MGTRPLSDSEKLMIFTGGISIEETMENWGYKEDDMVPHDEITKHIKNQKKKIIETLNARGDITNIRDILEDEPHPSGFVPFLFNLRIPFSLQKSYYQDLQKENIARTENFMLLYDGFIIFIATICNINERPWGVYDARDKFLDILSSIFDIKQISPCLTHQAISFLKIDEIPDIRYKDVYLNSPPDEDINTLLINIYKLLHRELSSFYNICYIRRNINKNIWDINKYVKELLDHLLNFIQLKWHEFFKKNNILMNIKNNIIKILINISKHNMMKYDYEGIINKMSNYKIHNSIFEEFMDVVNMEEYIKVENINIRDTINIIEHTRRVSETYQINLSTIFSALIGAIIGSTITIIFNYFINII